MTPLSLGMIVRNEAPMLALTLPIYAPFFPSKWALDTGSTDGTVDLLQSHGFVVTCTEWRNDYAAARNTLLTLKRLATTEGWILMLDADECIYPEVLLPELHHFTAQPFDLIRIPRINLAHRATLRDYTFDPNYASRLIRLSSSIHYHNKVHEECDIAPARLGTATNHIYHYGFCKPASRIWLNSHRYECIEAGKVSAEEVPDHILKYDADPEAFWAMMATRCKLQPYTDPHPLEHVYGRNQQST